MKLLLVAATKLELTNVYSHFEFPDEDFIETPNFDVLITGVGMTATAFALGKYLHPKYTLVLNVGIAGSFDQNIKLGSLVNITTDIFAEFGAEDHSAFVSIDELGFGNSRFEATHPFELFPKVKGITVNKVHGNAESIKNIRQRLEVQTESMEGAAVFYACTKSDVPCLQVRSISNYIEPRNKDNWQIGLAVKNLNVWIIGYLDSIM